jgi:hypothetical protein
LAEKLTEGWRLTLEINENQVEPFLDADRSEPEFFAIEIFNAFEFRSHQQSAIEAVGPAVVGAAKQLPVSATRGGVAGPMAANVIKAAEDAILAPGNEERLAQQIEREIVSGLSRLTDMADKLPGRRKKSFLFFFEVFRPKVKMCGES